MREWDIGFQKNLVAAGSFREVLALFCPKEAASAPRVPKPMSYSDLSRRLGLRSRSHVREIVEGLKPVPKNLPVAFCRALKVNASWTRYFELLDKAPADSLELRLIRQKLNKTFLRREITGSNATASTLLADPEIPAIFAALGDTVSGASAAEVIARTKLPAARVEECLEKLARAGVTEARAGRHVATNPHLIFSGIGEEEYFRQDLARSLERAKSKLRQNTNAQETLFFNSTFCVRSQDMQQLREELKQTLARYVDAAENSGGDQIVNLVTCLL